MDFQFSEDQKMFRATLKKFVADVVIPRAQEIDQDLCTKCDNCRIVCPVNAVKGE